MRIKNRLNINNIEAIFADIDGSTRGRDKFGKRLPFTTKFARLMLNIPVFPITGRSLNGWLMIKDFNKVFGTRKSAIYHSKTFRLFGRRRFIRPQTARRTKDYMKCYGCVVLNNGGTIASFDGAVIFEHHTFLKEEKNVLAEVFKKYFEDLDGIELSGEPGKVTQIFLVNANEQKLQIIRNQNTSSFRIYSVVKKDPDVYQIPYEKLKKIFDKDRSSKIGLGIRSRSAVEEILEILDNAGLEVTYNEGSLMITTKGINKRSGIQWIADHYGINIRNAIFIGNDHNDAPALTHPDLGVPIFIGNPNKVFTERLIKKYGNLSKNTILLESYDDLARKLSPLLLIPKKKRSNK